MLQTNIILFFQIKLFLHIYINLNDINIYEDKFIIKSIRKEYIINFDEILIINEIKKINNSLIPIKYKIMLKNNN